MSLLAGAAEADITPPFPVDLLGYVRRPLAPRGPRTSRCWPRPACFRDEDSGTTVVIIAADVVGLTTPMADRIRARVGELVGCDPAAVLLNSSHTPCRAVAGRDDQARRRVRRLDGHGARATGTRSRIGMPPPRSRRSGGSRRRGSRRGRRGRGLAVNRRERTADGRTILGWNREGVRDDSVVAIRIDGLDGRAARSPTPIATLVVVRLPPGRHRARRRRARAGLRRAAARASWRTSIRPGSVTVFLQGAAGDALPLESFRDDDGALSRPRLRRAARARGRPRHRRRGPVGRRDRPLDWGSVTPISLYRRRLADDQPPQVARARPGGSSRCRCSSCRPSTTSERELAERRADLAARCRTGRDPGHDEPDPLPHLWLELMLAQERRGRPRDGDRRRDLGGPARRLRDRRGAGRDLRGDRHGRPAPRRRPR